jgi:hypothetical protein
MAEKVSDQRYVSKELTHFAGRKIINSSFAPPHREPVVKMQDSCMLVASLPELG